jgi:hypothetical protein
MIRTFLLAVRVCFMAAVILGLLVIGGCGERPAPWGRAASGGATIIDPGAGGFGGDVQATSCDGDCQSPPDGWKGPSLFSFTSWPEVPPCPDVAPVPGLDAYTGLHFAPPICPECQCGPSDTTCVLPTDWHASAASCAGAANAESTPFAAPAGWQGACTIEDAIPAGALCGGAFCAQSVTVAAPEAVPNPCAPHAAGSLSAPPPTWSTRARECKPSKPGACPEAPPACDPPPGFSLCIYRDGDLACPDPHFTRHLFFQGADDERFCSQCQCGQPQGNGCVVFAAAYKDGACGAVAGAINVASGSQGGCFDVPAGFPLGAKTAQIVATQPGSCAQSGGKPGGRVSPADPVTVCCREPQVPG